MSDLAPAVFWLQANPQTHQLEEKLDKIVLESSRLKAKSLSLLETAESVKKEKRMH